MRQKKGRVAKSVKIIGRTTENYPREQLAKDIREVGGGMQNGEEDELAERYRFREKYLDPSNVHSTATDIGGGVGSSREISESMLQGGCSEIFSVLPIFFFYFFIFLLFWFQENLKTLQTLQLAQHTKKAWTFSNYSQEEQTFTEMASTKTS